MTEATPPQRKDRDPSREALRGRVAALPRRPGVYLFRDRDGRVLYVGKAKSLRSRVRSYFGSPSSRSLKLDRLVRRIAGVETFVVENEAESLLLEWNLIKEHSPPFNIQLRDDKSYPYIKVTVSEPFPRVFVTRRLERDGSRYFGPFTDVGAMRRALRSVKKMYAVRSCRYDLPEDAPERPCLDYHIGRCKAPCVGWQSREDYGRMIEEILQVLSGQTGPVKRSVRRRMDEASHELNYERAAELRDVLRGLEAIERRQTAVDFRGGDRDVLGVARDGGLACGVVLKVREGRLLGRAVHFLRNVREESPDEIAGALVKGFYLRQEELPPELVVPSEFEDRGIVREYLAARREGPFDIHVPQRGRKRRLLELAEENAAHLLRQETARARKDGGDADDEAGSASAGATGAAGTRSRGSRGDGGEGRRATAPPAAAFHLAEALGLEDPPRRLLCFDVSTLGGSDSVGSAVWLEDGAPRKSEYRKFRVRSVPEEGPDDYMAMQEIVGRYFQRRVREGGELPDLVLVDGGKGQLGAAAQALEAAGASDLPLASLAKREEEVFVPGVAAPIRLSRRDPGLHWLQRARDEAHRFAITYNRTLRRRRTLRSRLGEIEGVGPAREQDLLQRFGSLRAVRDASAEELAATPGIGRVTAERIRRALAEDGRETVGG